MVGASGSNPGFELMADFFHRRGISHRIVELDFHELLDVALRAFNSYLRPVHHGLFLLSYRLFFQWIASSH